MGKYQSNTRTLLAVWDKISEIPRKTEKQALIALITLMKPENQHNLVPNTATSRYRSQAH